MVGSGERDLVFGREPLTPVDVFRRTFRSQSGHAVKWAAGIPLPTVIVMLLGWDGGSLCPG